MRGGQTPIACVRILGGIAGVAADGTTVELPSAAQRRLLGVVAVHAPQRVRSEWLADLLGVSAGALRTTVARLRYVLGADVLQTVGAGYALGFDVDAARFCRALAEAHDAATLEALLELWTGTPLEEFAHEEWAAPEVRRLVELHAGAVDDYADLLLSQRRAVEAVAALERHIAAHPYRDRPRGLLLRALAQSGRQAEALRAFQQYRTLLANELGTAPSPEVVRVERRVATGWDGLDIDREVAASTLAFDLQLPPLFAPRAVFVGRGSERRDLRATLAEVAARSACRIVVVEGEAGIGKTSLLGAFARTATDGSEAVVLYGRCDESGAPLEPFRSLFDDAVAGVPVDLLHDHVTRHGGELARLTGQLRRRVETAPLPTTSDVGTARHLMFDAATDLFRRVAARRPLVVMIDDLQWAEPTALLLLGHLVRGLLDTPAMFVVSCRPRAAVTSLEVRRTLGNLERFDCRVMQLVGLDAGELGELAAAGGQSMSDDEARRLGERLLLETAGNPLYASQLVRHWTDMGLRNRPTSDTARRTALPVDDDLPPGLRELVWSRVRELGTDVEDVLTAACVLGVEFRESALIAMLDHDDTRVEAALDMATAAGITLSTAPSAHRSRRFVHATVVGALYSALAPSMRARLHERALRALAIDEPPSPDVVGELVRHSALAGRPADVLRFARCAGDHAFANLAPSEAAQHYRVAYDVAESMQLPDAERAELLVRLGDARHRAGAEDGFDTLARGADLARTSGNAVALVRAALAGDRGFVRLDESASEYQGIVESALLMSDPSDVDTHARLNALLARCLMYTPQIDRRVQLANEAWNLATSLGHPDLIAHVGATVLSPLCACETRERRREIAWRSVSAAETTGDPRVQFGAHHVAYTVAIETADAASAARSLARIRATAQRVREPRMLWILGLFDAFDAMMSGRLAEAEQIATHSYDLGASLGSPDAFTLFAAQYFVVGTFAGNHESLLPLVEAAMTANPAGLGFKIAHAIVCAAVGRVDDARRVLRAGAQQGFASLPRDNIWTTTVVGYAVLAIELEDVDAAAQLLPVVEPVVGEVAFNGVTSQGPIAAYAGKLASLVGRHGEADEHLHSALDIAAAFGWPYHRATTLFALAQARVRARGELDPAAREWLDEAAALCQAGGFRSWLPQIQALASA